MPQGLCYSKLFIFRNMPNAIWTIVNASQMLVCDCCLLSQFKEKPLWNDSSIETPDTIAQFDISSIGQLLSRKKMYWRKWLLKRRSILDGVLISGAWRVGKYLYSILNKYDSDLLFCERKELRFSIKGLLWCASTLLGTPPLIHIHLFSQSCSSTVHKILQIHIQRFSPRSHHIEHQICVWFLGLWLWQDC